ncbi:probable LRR receptor-like serine/threonine-protein kinase At3g47570 [Hibiscus syriacus]|uniref:probable LRR receptor-like serine/threonine-protein kinase At3g47570 n=1 Tax=Hibiscus syriacus TaxID=106335 RepID=UPI0019235EA8|nr:probable LRR receptor-like serine/threonine-protein kinase At3g47570 [Hibiscus syriacus]
MTRNNVGSARAGSNPVVRVEISIPETLRWDHYYQYHLTCSCFYNQIPQDIDLGLDSLGLTTTATTVVRGNDTDQQALLQFKAKITGDQLGAMESWNNSIHFCQWHGVTCGRKHQRVTKLVLQYQKLSGSLSPYIGNLSFLKELNLSNNNLYNRIPREIGRLRRLKTLELSNNSISGEIPSTLPACTMLTVVNIEDNQLTGEIPTSLGLLSNLKVLRFYNNSLRGSIPPSLGNLSSLENLALMLNGLTGIISEALGRLTNLSYFSITGNAISGIVPVAMFNLSNIRVFDVGEDKIQGTLHSDLEITMTYVDFFSIEGNQFSGQIPISVSNASNLYALQFGDNRLSGNVPSLEKLDKLVNLDIGKNHLGHGRKGDLNFVCTLVNNTKLEFLYIGLNNFGGVFPGCIKDFSSTLLHIAAQQKKITGRIPDRIGNLTNLELLSLSENQLSGPIPFDIGKLQKLQLFYAGRNSLNQTIPHSIGNLTKLTKLDLGINTLQGSIPSSLGNCQDLLLIDLSDNNLTGPIPREILRLRSLSIWLDLSSNYLTGELPDEVENLKNLGELYVSQNRLSGLLPNNLGSCVSLEKLLLDGNLFDGPIPSSWSSLTGLVELDLSDNNLSGEIPKFLVRFEVLQYLNLSFNDFEGLIPSEGVFKNASSTFVEGNYKLCGGILELHLSRCNPKTSSNTCLKLKIAVFVAILGVALVFTCLLILWFRKNKERKPTETCAENSLLQLSYQSILRATDGFAMQNLVGSGSFGSVYKGILEESGATIAVKVFNLLNRGASRSFLAECEALKNIRHQNIVNVLTTISGVDYKGDDFKALVYEFMANESLEDWLHPHISMNEPETTRSLNFFQRVNVVVDVAHALEYLHHRCETSILHCDLKPSNILLDDEMIGHISDFGLAKIRFADRFNHFVNHSSLLGLRGTIGYAPPEYGMGIELSTKGDVYSYGILLLEIFTGKRPTDERFKEGLSLHIFVKAALPDRVVEIIDPILLQECVREGQFTDITHNANNMGNDSHLHCLNSIFEIGLTCSAESPSERMDMNDVVIKLSSIQDKLLRPTRLHRGNQTPYITQSACNNVFLY